MSQLKEWEFDLQAELDRKVIESLSRLVNDAENGDIDAATYARSLQALNDASRGLVDAEVTQAIDVEWSNALRQAKQQNESGARLRAAG